MWQLEHYWALIAGCTTCLAVGVIWGAWQSRVADERDGWKSAAHEADKREATTQKRNLDLLRDNETLRRQLEAARQAAAARLVDPGDHAQ